MNSLFFLFVILADEESPVESETPGIDMSVDLPNEEPPVKSEMPGLDLSVDLSSVAVGSQAVGQLLTSVVWNRHSKRYFYFPDVYGNVHLIDTTTHVNKTAIDQCSRDQDCNQYWLYTRSNPKSKQVLQYGNKQSVKRSNFDPKKITIFTSHGWTGDGNTEMNILLTKVFLKKTDVNVIVLDWSKLAKKDYITSRSAVPMVGRMLGEFISWLRFSGMSLHKVHLVGHSLGGHVVGNAGKALKGKARRITALDPAGPLWYLDTYHRVSRTDARYVEVIHTNIFFAGYPFPSGHSDHYPNGGMLMPGCNFDNLLCHHARSWRYFAASIEFNNFKARKCMREWWSFQFIFDQCRGPIGLMGNSHINKRQSGMYRVNTQKDYPYAYPGHERPGPCIDEYLTCT